MSFSAFDISGSGMYAQRTMMDNIASNMANINTTRNPDGTPGVYVKKNVSFKAVYADRLSGTTPAFPNGSHEPYYSATNGIMALKGGVSFDEKNIAQGVEVAEITPSNNPYKTIYDPSHPESDADGFVTLPNINIVEEMVNMVSASRAYEANATTAETTKGMISAALRI
jgi:flagellar basal-body rod protein FlgC